jgi:tripartite-type tricarboxylate transporter receptor subunit TctC
MKRGRASAAAHLVRQTAQSVQRRRVAQLAALTLALPGFVVRAQAPAWPVRPLRLVVAFAPGGPADIVARLIAQQLQDKLGQQVVVDNRPGAGGNIAARLVARESADGYALLVTTSSIAVNQTLYKDPGYDAMADFTPVVLMAASPNILVAHPSEPAADLKAFLRAHKGQRVAYGSAGVGSTPHLTADHVLRVLGGLDAVHVPYQGAAPALQATAANQVPLASVALPPAVPLVRGGKVKALAVTSLKRIDALPDVPTVAESGFADFEDYTWVGLFGPARLPPDIVARLNTIVGDALRTPELHDKLAAAGMETRGDTPAAFAEYLKREIAKWGRIVKDTGVSAS